MRRPGDWMMQAELDLEAAGHMRDHDRFEWACFLAQQAAEKAAKAVHESEGTDARGHSVAGLLEGLKDVPEPVMDAAGRLDRHYIPTRYPNAHPRGAPGQLYRQSDAAEALGDARTVLDHVRGHLPQA